SNDARAGLQAGAGTLKTAEPNAGGFAAFGSPCAHTAPYLAPGTGIVIEHDDAAPRGRRTAGGGDTGRSGTHDDDIDPAARHSLSMTIPSVHTTWQLFW